MGRLRSDSAIPTSAGVRSHPTEAYYSWYPGWAWTGFGWGWPGWGCCGYGGYGGCYGGTRIVNVTNITNIYRNFRHGGVQRYGDRTLPARNGLRTHVRGDVAEHRRSCRNDSRSPPDTADAANAALLAAEAVAHDAVLESLRFAAVRVESRARLSRALLRRQQQRDVSRDPRQPTRIKQRAGIACQQGDEQATSGDARQRTAMRGDARMRGNEAGDAAGNEARSADSWQRFNQSRGEARSSGFSGEQRSAGQQRATSDMGARRTPRPIAQASNGRTMDRAKHGRSTDARPRIRGTGSRSQRGNASARSYGDAARTRADRPSLARFVSVVLRSSYGRLRRMRELVSVVLARLVRTPSYSRGSSVIRRTRAVRIRRTRAARTLAYRRTRAVRTPSYSRGSYGRSVVLARRRLLRASSIGRRRWSAPRGAAAVAARGGGTASAISAELAKSR